MMKINSEKIENPMVTLPYEQPSLKKYGTMKEFTLATSGSGGDGITIRDQEPNRNDTGSESDRARFDRGNDTGTSPGMDS
jgi:hypothetical protein